VAGSVVERVRDGFNGFVVEPNSAAAIAEAVAKSSKNPEEYKELVDNARSSAMEWPGSKATAIIDNVLVATSVDTSQ